MLTWIPSIYPVMLVFFYQHHGSVMGMQFAEPRLGDSSWDSEPDGHVLTDNPTQAAFRRPNRDVNSNEDMETAKWIDCATHRFSRFLQSGGPTVTSFYF